MTIRESLILADIPKRNSGSFRDPSGYVFSAGNALLRTVNNSAVDSFEYLWANKVYDRLIKRGLIVDFTPIELDEATKALFCGPRGELPARIIGHTRIPFFSYPYEWGFSQLKDAALAHLDLQIAALDFGAVLSDATPYNMQLIAGRMRHMDTLSLRPYAEGEMWAGYNQFCRLFLIPLLLEAWNGVPFQPLLRGALDGLKLSEAVRLFPKTKRWLSLNGLMHLSLHSHRERSCASNRNAAVVQRPTMPKKRYRVLLTELREWIARLKSQRQKSYWDDYAASNSYDSSNREIKKQFVTGFVAANKIKTLWDLGGNTGEYSIAALEAGVVHAIVIDSDLDAQEIIYAKSQQAYPGLIPVVMDCCDPSPACGWNQAERAGLLERGNVDAVLALALVHHLCIGRNIPLRSMIAWLVGLSPCGVVEFVPKDDPMVVRMLSLRDDVFPDYDEMCFLGYLREIAEITEIKRLDPGGRLLIAYRRSAE